MTNSDGYLFPGKKLSKIKLANWHTLKEEKLKDLRLIKLSINEENQFLNNIVKIGYDRLKSSNFTFKRKNLFRAFQRRYRQNLINGLADKECLLISKNLLKT